MLRTTSLIVIFATSVVLSIKFPRDKCDRPCFFLLAPVCASNGKTYPNDCVQKIAECKDSSIKFVHDGECRDDAEVCPDTTLCPDYRYPVCGTDGKTYKNTCYLRKAICNNPDLRQKHKGECKTVD